MSRRQRRYGGQGLALIKGLGEAGQTFFNLPFIRDVAAIAGVTPAYLNVLLHDLVRAGLLRRVKRGTYSLDSGLPGVAEPHPFSIGMALVETCAVSGWSALNYHGLTEQIPYRVTLTTPRRIVTPAMRGATRTEPSVWVVEGQEFELVRVIPAHFFGQEEVWLGDAKVQIFDRERALLDCFALPRRFGGLAEGLGTVEEHGKQIDAERLVAHALRYGTVAVAKRVGLALERVGVRASVIDPLRALPVQGQRLLDPTKPARGEFNSRWALRENLVGRR